MTNFWLFCVFISNIVVLLSATTPTETCVKTLSLCTLNAADDVFLRVGPKGNRGDPGDPGEKGEVGYELEDLDEEIRRLIFEHPAMQGVKGGKGDRGFPGLPGASGIKGVKGDTGPLGPKGLLGPDGLHGMPGLPGILGVPGLPGLEGEEGDMGIPGPIGPPGPPGTNGFCPCSYPTLLSSSDFGDAEYPAKVVCKASRVPVETGEYFIGPNPMKVKCVSRPNTTTLTCIPPVSAKPRTFTYKSKLWLSQKGLTIEEIYGINRDQFTWIQNSSNSAFQTIRYHCLNSNPFPRDNASNSVLLLSWNDNTIGPMPTLTKPFFYTVLPETDGCSNATESEWSFTDIKLVSNSIPRVPVIDFYIRDVRHGQTQSVKIEHIELCFD